eukprot:m51a1_g8725 hypothetical protein (1426) ;mRNA; r:181307-186364
MSGAFISEARTLRDALCRAFAVYRDLPLLGHRPSPSAAYSWLTYSQVHSLSSRLALWLERNAGEAVALCADNRAEWLVADFACALAGVLSVGFHVSWPRDEVEHIAGDARVTCAVAGAAQAPMFCGVAGVSKIVVVGSPAEVDRVRSLAGSACSVYSFDDVARSQPSPADPAEAAERAGEYYTVIYSSGTTGPPRGLGVTRARWLHDSARGVLGRLGPRRVAVSHAPLAHGMDRGVAWQTLFAGGRLGFARGDFAGLVADLRELRPSMLAAMPHFWCRLHAEYLAAVRREALRCCAGAERAADVAEALCAAVERGVPGGLAGELRARAAAEARESVGGAELRLAATGGARTPESVLAWMREVLGPEAVVDAYGTTEVPGIASNGAVSDDVELRLEDERGRPARRGEIVVRARGTVARYWGDTPEAARATRAAFGDDGWFHTGDVGELGDDGRLRVVDRKANVAELYVRGRSVWVAAAELEARLLGACAGDVESVYLHSDRAEGTLVAVVVPRGAPREPHAYLESLRAAARACGFQPWEVPRAVVVSGSRWTAEGGELSATGKLRRGELGRRYAPQIAAQYSRLEAASDRREAAAAREGLDYARDFEFVGDDEQDTAALNASLAAVRAVALRLRAALPASSERRRSEEARARAAVAGARESGLQRVAASVRARDVRAAVADFAALRSDVQRAGHTLDLAQTAEDPEVAALQAELRAAVDALCDVAARCCVDVPYQVRSGALVLPPAAARERGCIPECAGFDNWRVWCAACGVLVEWGSEGLGAERYKCLDCLSGPCYCSPCCALLRELRDIAGSDADAALALRGFDAHVSGGHCVVRERAHPIWLRDAVVPAGCRPLPALVARNAFAQWAERPCLGMPLGACARSPAAAWARSRPGLSLEHDGFLWLTYGAVGSLVASVARGLAQALCPAPPGSFVGICGPNCLEWAIADFACAAAGFRPVGFHTTFSGGELAAALGLVQPAAMLCCSRTAAEQARAVAAPLGVAVVELDAGLQELAERGAAAGDAGLPGPEQLEAVADVFTLLFTSGSASAGPRAVVVSAAAFFATVAASPVFAEPLVGALYIPLSHSSDRTRLWEFVVNGGRVGFVEYAHSSWSDHEQDKKDGMLGGAAASSLGVEDLFGVVRQLSPSAIACPPRIWNGLYFVYRQRLAANGGDERAAREHVAGLFGTRLAFCVTGGAPTSPEVLSFARSLFPCGVAFHESYGTTEAGGITEDGLPMHGVELRLRAVPELGVGPDDKPPRGEVVVRTRTMASGYYGDPQATAEAFLPGGWYRTGDLGTTEPDGRLRLLERVSAAQCLAEGRLFCPSRAEAAFESVPPLQHVRELARPVALVAASVPVSEGEAIEAMRGAAQRGLVEECEVPGRVAVVDAAEWAPGGALVNGHLKKRRAAIQTRYASTLASLLSA